MTCFKNNQWYRENCLHNIFHGHVHLRRVDLNIIDIFHLAQK